MGLKSEELKSSDNETGREKEIQIGTGYRYGYERFSTQDGDLLLQQFKAVKAGQGRERKEQQFFCILDERKYMLNDNGEYEPFVVFGKSAIKLSELKAAVRYLELKEQERGDNNRPTVSKSIKKTWS